MDIGTPELILILAIVILIFGVGRIGKIGKELGQGLRSFREGLRDPVEEKSMIPAPEEASQRVQSTTAGEDKSTL
jgi:sec-independent protein translocase protein TatA